MTALDICDEKKQKKNSSVSLDQITQPDISVSSHIFPEYLTRQMFNLVKTLHSSGYMSNGINSTETNILFKCVSLTTH